MRATRIRSNGLKVPKSLLKKVCKELVNRLNKKGFITNSFVVNSSSIEIGLHMRCFSINTAKIGYNARIHQYIKSPKGYKRTNVPTWEQRVEFNDIVNDVFNKYNLDAKIVSANFEIRHYECGARYENDWYNPGSDIMSESEAREICDSDKMERVYKQLGNVKVFENWKMVNQKFTDILSF